jgi:hypothetical protein
MGIQLKNNASGTLATAISASDTGIVLTTGNGASFPALGASDYFYATLESTGGTTEIVKVTARSGDSMTIARAQDGSTANSFAAGSRFELRINAAATTDFLQSGAGAVVRNFRDKLREIVSVKDFGAVGDGVTDDTNAIKAAISAIKANLALNPALMPTINYEIGANQVALVPVTLTGGSGMYKVSEPIEFTRVTGLKVNNLNLIASDTFVGDYLVVVGDAGAYLGVDNFTYENSLLNANFKAGGIKFTDTMRCLLFNTEILGFKTNGVYITADVPPSFGNYETQVVNCYLGTTPSGGTVPPGVVLNDTVGILVNNTDNVFRNNQIFMVGVGIKTLPRSGNDMIQGNHIYSASLYPMDINSYPVIIDGNYFDDLSFIIRQPIYVVVTNNYFFGTATATTDKFIILQPPFPNFFFQRLTISDNNFLNLGNVKCESIVVDTTNGTFDYANTRNVDITGNVFSNVKFVGSKIRQKIAINQPAATAFLFDLGNTQAIGYVGQVQYTYKQNTPNPFLPVGVGTVVTSVLTGVGGQQAFILFDRATAGDLYIECDINTISDNTI